MALLRWRRLRRYLYRFFKRTHSSEADVNYTGLLHRPGNLFDLGMFDGDENAIVVPSMRLPDS